MKFKYYLKKIVNKFKHLYNVIWYEIIDRPRLAKLQLEKENFLYYLELKKEEPTLSQIVEMKEKVKSEYGHPGKSAKKVLDSLISKSVYNFNCSEMSTIENFTIDREIVHGNFKDCANCDDRTLGYCVGNFIVINTRSCTSEQLESVVAHEVAHVIDKNIRNFTCHDSFWQSIYNSCYDKAEYYLKSHGV